MDDSRNDDIRADEEPREDTTDEPARSPWEPPRGDSAPEPAATAGEDTFARLNTVPDEDGGMPPFVVTERDFGVGEEPKAPSKAATFVAFGVVVMAVLGILMSIAAVKLFMERADMSAALEQSTDQLAMVYAGPEATDTSKRRIAWLQKSVGEGDYAQAQKAIQALGAPETERPSPVDVLAGPGEDEAGEAEGQRGERRLPEPADADDLPIEAQTFFEQHPKLWEAFFGLSVAIRQMQEAEVPAEDFVNLRSQMVEAAQLGQTKKVEDLLNQARAQMQSQAQNQGQRQRGLPQGLQQRLQAFGQAMQQAQRERRDVRAAVALAQQSERAAQQGNIDRAEQLMDRAIEAVKNAPRVQMPQRRPGAVGGPGGQQMPQMGPEIGLIKFVADLATNVMQAEQRDLTEIWESINIAAGAIREKNAEQIREILGEAKESFSEIGDRRREMQAAIERAQEKVRQAREGNAPPADARPSEEEQRERQEIVMERVATLLAQVRSMPESEFEANKAQIAQAMLQAMTAPVQGPGERPEMTPEERVRQKMRLAGEMYRELKQKTDADTTELDETFAEVRERITEHEYEAAEKLVDEGVAMMREIAAGEAPEDAGAEDTGGYGPQLELGAPSPSLDLGAGEGELRIPRPPTPQDAQDISDDANEGVEQ